jgi:hypothetical protein
MVASYRLADLWANEMVTPVRDKLPEEIGELAGHIEKRLGAPPDQVERATVIYPNFPPRADLAIVALKKPYSRDKVAALVGTQEKEEKIKGRTLLLGDAGSVGLLSDRVYVIGQADEVRELLGRPAKEKEGPLTPVRKLMQEKHTVVLGLSVPALATAIGDNLPPPVEPLRPLLAARSLTVALDLGGQTRAGVRLAFAGEEEARKGVKAMRAGLDLVRRQVAEGKTVLPAAGYKGMDKLLEAAEAALRDAKAEQDGAELRVAASLKVDPVAATPALANAFGQQRKTALRIQSQNNLKQIVLAMHNYHDTQGGTFPPRAVFAKDGKPQLSWRVLLLPYLAQNDLYMQFHLDEPWDSEHNKKLLAKMPRVYAAPGQKETSSTPYRGFSGKGAFFDGKKGLRIADITDGTSNTIMIVEAPKGVPWTKPEDLPYDPEKAVPKLVGQHEGGFYAGFCDGSVHFISPTAKPATLHLLIQRNDGQSIPDDF